MLQPKCRQPYVHNDRKMENEIINDDLITPNLPPRPPLPRTSQSSTTIDKDLAKQQQLSDWYYIKTGPKSPLPTPRRNNIYGSTTAPAPTPAIRTTTTNNNTIEGIYGKNGNLSRESTKNNLNMYGENMKKRVENGSARFVDDVQITKTNGNNDKDTTENVYQAINAPSSSDNIQKMYTTSSVHQYSGGEPLCKFNLRNNSEKVNGCSKWQQPPEIQQRIHMIAPPSPSVLSKKLHQPPPPPPPSKQQQTHHSQQSHPFYYVEPSKKHLSSPRQDKHSKSVEFQQKSTDPQCEQIQLASKLHSHNERLNSATTLTTMMSNSNSNLHKVSGAHSQHQQTDHCGNVNSSSFEHVNVTSGISSLSASSEMTIDDKRHFNNQNYADEQCFRSSNNVVGESRQCLQQTVSASPSPSLVRSSNKVSDTHSYIQKVWFFVVVVAVRKKSYRHCLLYISCCYCCWMEIGMKRSFLWVFLWRWPNRCHSLQFQKTTFFCWCYCCSLLKWWAMQQAFWNNLKYIRWHFQWS